MKLLFEYSAVCILLLFLYAGCAYNPGSNPDGPGKTIPPKTGSSYVYNNTPIDTNGIKKTDSPYTTVDSVSAIGTSYSGKTNVTHMNSRNLKTGLVTSTYINYESNADISIYAGGSFLSFLGIKYPDWVTYPAQSHISTGFRIFDDTIKILPVPIHLVVVDSILYVNSNTFSVNNSSLAVFNLNLDRKYRGAFFVLKGFPGIPIVTHEITTVAFAPSLGYFADRIEQPTHVPQGLFPSIQDSEMTLVSYNLK